MRKPITNQDVIKTIHQISDEIDDTYLNLNTDLIDFILGYLIANTDDIQLAWNDSIEGRDE